MREGGYFMNNTVRKWFRDSKIVDEKNNPMVLYHGTKNFFQEFDKDKIGSSNKGFLGKGFYFTKFRRKAEVYGDLIHAYLRIENPFIINGKLDKNTVNIINEVSDTCAFKEGMDYTDVYNELSYAVPELPEIAELITLGLQGYGYDGIIYGNFEEVVCFEPDQILIIKKEARL